MAKSPNVLAQVYQKLGGRAALGEEVASEADLARVVARRIPLRALSHFTRSGFSEQEVAEYVIPPRTRRHRKVRREPLTVDESDRLVRLTGFKPSPRTCSEMPRTPTGGCASRSEFWTADRLSKWRAPIQGRD